MTGTYIVLYTPPDAGYIRSMAGRNRRAYFNPITPPKTPTYSIHASEYQFNEGETFTTTISTTNVETGTKLYWSTAYDSEKINAASDDDFQANTDLSKGVEVGVVESDGTFKFSLTLSNDYLDEEPEAFIVNLYTDTWRNNKVASSPEFTIRNVAPQLKYSDLLYDYTPETGANVSDAMIEKLRGKNTISYYIDDYPTDYLTVNATEGTFNFYSHLLDEKNYINDIFSYLDDYLPINFQRVLEGEKADIAIFASDENSIQGLERGATNVPYDFDKKTIPNRAEWNKEETYDYFATEVFWVYTNKLPSLELYPDLSIYDAHTIIKFISIALGLTPPQGKHSGIGFSLKDTVMSYDIDYDISAKSLSAPIWSDTDIEVLQSIWGATSPVIKTYEKSSYEYKFYNRGDGKYEIKTPTGFDEITGISILDFPDKDLRRTSDIEEVFDQVTGLNTDSGKMFRLYNAAFARLPDRNGLQYWIEKYSSGENDERAVASSFLISDEFAQRYGSNVSESIYVNNLYKNVLGRDADNNGMIYWLGQLNSGAETRYEVLLGFSESAENKALFTDMTGFG